MPGNSCVQSLSRPTSSETWARLACAGKLQGFGFVQFATPAAVEAALRMSGAALMGRELTVDAASADGGGGAPAATGEPVEGCWFCLSNPNADVNLVASIGACGLFERVQRSCALLVHLSPSICPRPSMLPFVRRSDEERQCLRSMPHQQCPLLRHELCCLDIMP